MNLRKFTEDLKAFDDYKPNCTRHNSFEGQDILRKINCGVVKFTDVGVNHEIVAMIMFGITIPPCYFKEDVNGHRECIHGHSILSTIKGLLQDPEAMNDPRLYNLVYNVVVPFITFDYGTPLKQMDACTEQIRKMA